MLKNFGSKSANTVVLDLEGFKLKSIGFIIKELCLCCSYYDTIFFKPPVSFAELPAHDQHCYLVDTQPARPRLGRWRYTLQ